MNLIPKFFSDMLRSHQKLYIYYWLYLDWFLSKRKEPIHLMCREHSKNWKLNISKLKIIHTYKLTLKCHKLCIVERLRLRLQICLNLTSVLICLNFRLIHSYKLKYGNKMYLDPTIGRVTTSKIKKNIHTRRYLRLLNCYVMHLLFLFSMNVLSGNLSIFLLILNIKRKFELVLVAILKFLWNKQ